jgi:hypothetical protein
MKWRGCKPNRVLPLLVEKSLEEVGMQTSGVLSILYLVYCSCDLATQEKSNCAGLETKLEEILLS